MILQKKNGIQQFNTLEQIHIWQRSLSISTCFFSYMLKHLQWKPLETCKKTKIKINKKKHNCRLNIYASILYRVTTPGVDQLTGPERFEKAKID